MSGIRDTTALQKQNYKKNLPTNAFSRRDSRHRVVPQEGVLVRTAVVVLSLILDECVSSRYDGLLRYSTITIDCTCASLIESIHTQSIK
jgi:hypothetical protein